MTAAFFDLDGTLFPLPTLERRFFRALRYRRAIPAASYFRWFREALRLLPRGLNAVLYSNKMYLSGVNAPNDFGGSDDTVSARYTDGHQGRGRATAPPWRNPPLPIPLFFEQGIETVVHHARKGHQIVLLSGTLEPLAKRAGLLLQAELAAKGVHIPIRVFATRLEERNGKWTGRISGEALFGPAKARLAARLAAESHLSLSDCYSYGDSLHDRWLLESVGRPAAVNPSNDLLSIARAQGWPVLQWRQKRFQLPECPARSNRKAPRKCK